MSKKAKFVCKRLDRCPYVKGVGLNDTPDSHSAEGLLARLEQVENTEQLNALLESDAVNSLLFLIAIRDSKIEGVELKDRINAAKTLFREQIRSTPKPKVLRDEDAPPTILSILERE